MSGFGSWPRMLFRDTDAVKAFARALNDRIDSCMDKLDLSSKQSGAALLR
jgi:hypothetical protein